MRQGFRPTFLNLRGPSPSEGLANQVLLLFFRQVQPFQAWPTTRGVGYFSSLKIDFLSPPALSKEPQIAWPQIVENVGPRLLRFFCLSFDRSTSADLVQETFIRAWKKAQFQNELGSMESYLFGFARMIRLEHLRKTYQQKEVTSGEAFATPESVDLQSAQIVQGLVDEKLKDNISHMQRAISHLNTNEQEVVSLILNDELTFSEISQILNMPVGTIKSHFHRAKEKLKSLMEKII
jgi:RNA polymerase sigma-70 factor, ECF subfamily